MVSPHPDGVAEAFGKVFCPGLLLSVRNGLHCRHDNQVEGNPDGETKWYPLVDGEDPDLFIEQGRVGSGKAN